MANNTETNKEITLFKQRFNTRILFLLLFYIVVGVLFLYGLLQLFLYYNPFKGNIVW